jgi:hypothetical protein
MGYQVAETILGLLIGMSLVFLGGVNIYNNRRLLGSALIGSGWLFGGLSLGFLWLTNSGF